MACGFGGVCSKSDCTVEAEAEVQAKQNVSDLQLSQANSGYVLLHRSSRNGCCVDGTAMAVLGPPVRSLELKSCVLFL